jgi:DNA topoisomerase VI subunit A
MTTEETAGLGEMISTSRGVLVKNSTKKNISPFGSPTKLRMLSQTVYLMNTIHRLVCENRKVTQRELFYRSLSDRQGPGFSEQVTLNRALISLTDALGCDRHDLGVFTTVRGLVAADPEIETLCLDEDSEFIADLSAHPDGLSVSETLAVGITTISTSARCVLIVEKDTLFQSLVTSPEFFKRTPCILVTARGYPDNITIRFLQRLGEIFNHELPFLYLGDLDPHGISIYLTYTHAVGQWIEWIGLKSEDVAMLDNQAVLGLKLKPTDTAMINSLLGKESTPDSLKSELAKIEMRGLKFEVECLHASGEYFLAEEWIPGKVKPFL